MNYTGPTKQKARQRCNAPGSAKQHWRLSDMVKGTCSIDGCTRSIFARGWCKKHYQRWYSHGDPTVVVSWSPARDWLEQHLNSDHPEDECIEWPFALTDVGYSQILLDGRLQMTTRVVLRHATGIEPTDMDAAHAPEICHNRSCLNRNHLRWATRQENMADKRLDGTWQTGSNHPQATIDEETAVAIFKATGTAREIAEQFKTTKPVVHAIKQGRTWRRALTEAGYGDPT